MSGEVDLEGEESERWWSKVTTADTRRNLKLRHSVYPAPGPGSLAVTLVLPMDTMPTDADSRVAARGSSDTFTQP